MRFADRDGKGDNQRCPRCNEYILDSELIFNRMDTINRRYANIIDLYSKFEWVILENAENIRNMDKNGLEVEPQSFDYAIRQAKEFVKLLDIIDAHMDKQMREFDKVIDME